jgi:hypothetical protein
MRRRRPLEESFLLGVPVEAGDRAEPTGDRRPSAPSGFEVAGEALDVCPADGEQAQVMLVAPGDELAQIQRVRVAGLAPVAGEERS